MPLRLPEGSWDESSSCGVGAVACDPEATSLNLKFQWLPSNEKGKEHRSFVFGNEESLNR